MSCLTAFTQAYVVCARFTEDMEDFEFSEEAFNRMADECKDFFTGNTHLLDKISAKQAGHDFWLTRNGHGEGYWSRGHGKLGDSLTQRSEMCGACDLYVGDDNLIHVA